MRLHDAVEGALGKRVAVNNEGQVGGAGPSSCLAGCTNVASCQRGGLGSGAGGLKRACAHFGSTAGGGGQRARA
eukprot:420643-Pyramimonas_sp.AAC.2